MLKPIPLDIAQRAAQRLCTDASVDLVLPGDPRRELVVLAMALVHSLKGTGWTREHIAQNVSVTVPGMGVLAQLLHDVPVAGPMLGFLADAAARPMVMLSPTAWGDSVTLLGTIGHELGHVGELRAADAHAGPPGSVAWCLAYGLDGVARAGAEAPCYGADMAHRVLLGGLSVDHVRRDAETSLMGYGLDTDARILCVDVLDSHAAALAEGVDPTGTVARSLAALALEGWRP